MAGKRFDSRVRARLFTLLGGLITALLLLALLPETARAASGPEVSVGDATILEGDSGQRRPARVTFTLSQPVSETVFITWRTQDDTAVAGEDYRPKNNRTTRIRPGRIQGFAAVQIIPDLAVEGDETLKVEITDVSPAIDVRRGTGTITILDDDPTSGPELAVGDVALVEGNVDGKLRAFVPLTLSEPVPGTLTVNWTLVDGTATAGEDYVFRVRTTSIRGNRTRAFIPVFITPDTLAENDETFTVQITSVTGAAVTQTRPSGTVTIINDDGFNLASWGLNGNGQLGLNDTTQRTDPTQIDDDPLWHQVSAGGLHTLAVKTDGTLWAWGRNSDAQLGDGTTTQRVVPTQIGSGTDWTSVSAGDEHSLAIKSDGTLWAWGSNNNGRLGDGTTTERNTPTQIGSDTDWEQVSAGDSHSLGVKTDGTAWAWGNNVNGRTGLGTDTGNTLTPTQIGTDTNWATVSAGGSHSLARRTNGTAWAWGSNVNGRTGLNTDTGNTLTPTQIGTDTGWGELSTGGSHSLGRRAF